MNLSGMGPFICYHTVKIIWSTLMIFLSKKIHNIVLLEPTRDVTNGLQGYQAPFNPTTGLQFHSSPKPTPHAFVKSWVSNEFIVLSKSEKRFDSLISNICEN